MRCLLFPILSHAPASPAGCSRGPGAAQRPGGQPARNDSDVPLGRWKSKAHVWGGAGPMANGGQKLTKTPLQKPRGDPPAPLPPILLLGGVGGGVVAGARPSHAPRWLLRPPRTWVWRPLLLAPFRGQCGLESLNSPQRHTPVRGDEAEAGEDSSSFSRRDEATGMVETSQRFRWGARRITP